MEPPTRKEEAVRGVLLKFEKYVMHALPEEQKRIGFPKIQYLNLEVVLFLFRFHRPFSR